MSESSCPRSSSRAGTVRGTISLNDATVDELQRLPGVGEAKARRIVRWRQQHGRFRRVIDLRRVRGFGRKTVARLAPYLTVHQPDSVRIEAGASR